MDFLGPDQRIVDREDKRGVGAVQDHIAVKKCHIISLSRSPRRRIRHRQRSQSVPP